MRGAGDLVLWLGIEKVTNMCHPIATTIIESTVVQTPEVGLVKGGTRGGNQ